MAGGIEATLRVLMESPSDSADDLLIAALRSQQRDIQEGALLAILGRRKSRGPNELVAHWSRLSPRWRTVLSKHSDCCVSAIQEAILSPNPARCRNGCEAARALHCYEAIPTLLSGIEVLDRPDRALFLETFLALVESLYEDLAGPRDFHNRRDPQLVRQYTLAALEASLERFAQHRTPEIAEAFLMLANRDHSGFRRILQSPGSVAHAALIDRMTVSPRPGVMRLVLSILDDLQPPRAALNIIVRRRDIQFVRQLLRKLAGELEPATYNNLKRLGKTVWLADDRECFGPFSEREQAACVRFAVALHASRDETVSLLKRMLVKGKPGGRAAAALALANFKGADINSLVLERLEDPDPRVRANLLPQLRSRGIPGAIDRLLEELDNASEIVKAACRASLSDFSFARYAASFDKLDTITQVSDGKMVLKIDPQTIPSLDVELSSDVRSRRLRAIEIVTVLGCIEQMQDRLLRMLADTDHFIRMATINALGTCDNQATREALNKALSDPHTAVREAATAALQTLDVGRGIGVGQINLIEPLPLDVPDMMTDEVPA